MVFFLFATLLTSSSEKKKMSNNKYYPGFLYTFSFFKDYTHFPLHCVEIKKINTCLFFNVERIHMHALHYTGNSFKIYIWMKIYIHKLKMFVVCLFTIFFLLLNLLPKWQGGNDKFYSLLHVVIIQC